jgi:hypothetical protein
MEKFGSGIEKIRIRDKHPGSETLLERFLSFLVVHKAQYLDNILEEYLRIVCKKAGVSGNHWGNSKSKDHNNYACRVSLT